NLLDVVLEVLPVARALDERFGDLLDDQIAVLDDGVEVVVEADTVDGDFGGQVGAAPGVGGALLVLLQRLGVDRDGGNAHGSMTGLARESWASSACGAMRSAVPGSPGSPGCTSPSMLPAPGVLQNRCQFVSAIMIRCASLNSGSKPRLDRQ